MASSDLDSYFSSTWTGTIDRCKTFLEPDDLEKIERTESWDKLQKEVFDPGCSKFRNTIPREISLTKLTFGRFYQFTSIFELKLVPGNRTAFFWGISSVLLQLAARDQQALHEIPRMLKLLGYKTERFQQFYFASSLENLNEVKEVCFDIQVQLVEFFTTAVNYIRGEVDNMQDCKQNDRGDRQEIEDPSSLLQREFSKAEQVINEALERIKMPAPPNLSPVDQTGFTDITAIAQPLPLLKRPSKLYPSFFNRVETFEQIAQVLRQDSFNIGLQSITLYGLGGVGKSSIAARYFEKAAEEKKYDAILWVYGETKASLRQSFTEIALLLKLPGAQPNLHDENLLQVQKWFQTSDLRWLVVYDNVEDGQLLMPYWPEASHGNAIITTRNHNLVYKFASSGLEITSWNVEKGSEFLLFLLKDSINRDIQGEGTSASELAEKLSGHALGISHMAGLIQRRSWSITEFMKIYLKYPERLHKSELEAVWNVSFATLDNNSQVFLGVASFLVPDNIPQELFEITKDDEVTEDLEFCTSGFRLSEAIEPLLTLALIKRDRYDRTFSCHRMVQTQFRYFLAPEKRQQAFNNAVALVYQSFPKQSDTTNKNQLYQQWTQCNRCLQHVLHLKKNFREEREHSRDFKASWLFCELLKDCQRFLYEINALEELGDVCDTNLQAVETLDDPEQAIDIKASTLSHLASMYESIGKVDQAIQLNIEGRNMRLNEKQFKGGLIGGFEQNLAYNYNTANQHDTALEWFERSRDTWIAWNVQEGREADWPTNTKKNTARCLMYLGRYDEAQALLDTAIKEMRQEKPFNWAMLAYSYFVMGSLERRRHRFEAAEAHFMEAQNMWFKGDLTRLHPFNAGCIYKTGVVCLDQGKLEAAVKHLRDSLETTKFHSNTMPAEHARGLFKLSEALTQSSFSSIDAHSIEDEAQKLRDDAEEFLLKRDKNVVEFGNEDAYDKWVPIFWR